MLRRQFGLAAATFATLGIAHASASTPRGGDSALDVEINRLFSDPAGAAEVGRRYLAAYPSKNSRAALLADLIETNSMCAPSASEHPFALWQQRDFRDGAVVQLDGWILARTEVSLCALLYLGSHYLELPYLELPT